MIVKRVHIIFRLSQEGKMYILDKLIFLLYVPLGNINGNIINGNVFRNDSYKYHMNNICQQFSFHNVLTFYRNGFSSFANYSRIGKSYKYVRKLYQ